MRKQTAFDRRKLPKPEAFSSVNSLLTDTANALHRECAAVVGGELSSAGLSERLADLVHRLSRLVVMLTIRLETDAHRDERHIIDQARNEVLASLKSRGRHLLATKELRTPSEMP